MKKVLIFALFALTSIFLLPLTPVSARVLSSLGEEETDYYAVEANDNILDLQFEGEGTWGDKNGLYSPNTYEENGKLVYTGAASYTNFMTIKPNDAYKDAILIVDVVAELIGVDQFYATARLGYGSNAYPDILRENGFMSIAYDETGKVVSYAKRSGWLGGSDDCSKDLLEITSEGYVHMQMIVCTNEKGIAEIGFEIVGVDPTNATIKIESLTITKANYNAVYNLEFNGEGAWGDKDGLYSPNTAEVNGQLVYTTTDAGAQFAWVKANDAYKNAMVVIESEIELNNVSALYLTARQDWNSNAYPSILRETGIWGITYDVDGKLTSFANRPGWLNLTDDYNRDILRVTEDGKLYMREVIFTGDAGITEISMTVEGEAGVEKSIKFDYLKMSVAKFPESTTTYYTYAWNTSFDDLDTTRNPWEIQTIWANDMSWETENPLDGTHSIKVSGSATEQVQIGGFDTTTEGKKLLHSTGLHYIQMDVDSADFEWFNIWTSGADYYDIKFSLESGWSAVGKVQNFEAVDLGHCYRISYYVDYTDVSTPHNINVYNGTGSIYFDNLIVAYVDNAPFVESGLSYDLIDTQDVVAKIGLKGAAEAVLYDAFGNSVDASLYTVNNDTLTLNKALFDGADSYDFTLQTANGSRAFVVNKNDNRIVLSGLAATNISKVYDGTTVVDLTNVQASLVGVLEGDDVEVSFDVEYQSANVGSEIALVVTNLAISGDDAYKYILPAEVSLTGAITAKEISFTTSDITKVYDGTTVADLTNVQTSLVGALEGEDVEVSFTAEYQSANVGSEIALVVNAVLSGEDASNYVLAQVNLTGAITAKVITVVANNATKVEGEADPELTYTVTGLVGEDTLSGALTRTSGEEVGKYDITIGTLTASENYTIEFTKGELEITAKADEPTAPVDPNEPTNPVDPNEPTDPSDEPADDPISNLFGCSASVVSSIFGMLAMALMVVVLRKKREE